MNALEMLAILYRRSADLNGEYGHTKKIKSGHPDFKPAKDAAGAFEYGLDLVCGASGASRHDLVEELKAYLAGTPSPVGAIASLADAEKFNLLLAAKYPESTKTLDTKSVKVIV